MYRYEKRSKAAGMQLIFLYFLQTAVRRAVLNCAAFGKQGSFVVVLGSGRLTWHGFLDRIVQLVFFSFIAIATLCSSANRTYKESFALLPCFEYLFPLLG